MVHPSVKKLCPTLDSTIRITANAIKQSGIFYLVTTQPLEEEQTLRIFQRSLKTAFEQPDRYFFIVKFKS